MIEREIDDDAGIAAQRVRQVAAQYQHVRVLVGVGIDGPVQRNGVLVWEAADPIVYRWEPMQPYYDRLLPWVTIGTTSSDWSRAGAAYLELIDEKLATDRIADTARRLVRGIDDERTRIEVVSRYVQKELHYEAIEFGRRAYVPKTARETLRDRYGDCKDQSVLLITMLGLAGIVYGGLGAIGTHNAKRMLAYSSIAHAGYLLIGFGRWGSSDQWLGIPVTWGQICGAKVIVEALRTAEVDPK